MRRSAVSAISAGKHLQALCDQSASSRLSRPSQQPCLICQTRLSSHSRSRLPSRRWLSSSPSLHKEAVRPITHYDFFPQSISSGPPPKGSFSVDERDLRKEFLQLQAKAHPDRHPQEAKSRAEATSARINEAYKVLQNPLLRAQYLLSLRGIDVAEDESAKVEDPDLLMEVLETREEIEAAEEEEELEPLKEQNESRIEASVKVLEEAFSKDDLDTASQEAVRLRYWINIRESLHGWEKGKPVVLVH